MMREVGAGSDGLEAARSRMHVVLVRGPIVSTAASVNNEAVPAIGLAYIAGYVLKKGYRVTLVDAVAEGLNSRWPLEAHPGYECQGLTFGALIDRIPADADVIALSIMFSGEWPAQRALVSAIRERFPDKLIVAGGEHTTALSEFSLRDCRALDVCIRGEGEHALFELLEALREGRDYRTVGSIGYLTASGEYVETSALTRVRDVDSIPWPHWPDGYLEKFWAAGKSYGVQTERDMPMMVSRGCPFQCTFCSSPRMWTQRYILRDVDDVIAEIKHAVARYGITAVQLYDLTAITKKAWAVELCQKMIQSGIRLQWSLPSGTRSEALDFETVSLLKQTGCNYLVYAPESGSPSTLKRIKKQISLENVKASIQAARQVGLVLRTNLIIGFPFETRADVFQTIWFGLGLAVRGVDEVSINIYSPYPGTELFEELRSKGKLALDDAYFLSLTSLNSDYTRVNPLTFNEHMGPRELAVYRIGFMLTNYAVGYVLYPSRIVRTLRNTFSKAHATTVFEHRVKDLVARWRSKGRPKPPAADRAGTTDEPGASVDAGARDRARSAVSSTAAAG
ncbi:MAG: B12-binding domain-containing radical SAM protein [Myxococcales bacterium]|nr:B12-binding domain-containing radical SAM protein [Myxococcales bacterium]